MRKYFIKGFCFILSVVLLRAAMAGSMGLWASKYSDTLGDVTFIVAGTLGHFGASMVEYFIQLYVMHQHRDPDISLTI